jgi:hypothetical protein
MSGNATYIRTKAGQLISIWGSDIVNLNNESRISIPGTPFISCCEAKDKTLWVGKSKGGGVYAIPPNHSNTQSPVHYLKGESVSDICEDNEGGFWFTTLENGVYYMASPNILYFDKSNGLSDNTALSLLQKDSISIWAGMNNGKIYSLSLNSVVEEEADPGVQEPVINPIYALYNNPSHSKIIAGAWRSFQFVPRNKYKPEYLRHGTDHVAFKCFANDSHNNCWGGNYVFIAKIKKDEKNFSELFFAKSRIISLYCNQTDTVWMGCVNGLWSLHDGKSFYWGDRYPLLKNRIEDIKVSSDNRWWFATKGGGIIVKQGNNFLEINESSGLASNTCRTLFIDKSGTVWVGTNMGISKIRMENWGDFKIESYSMNNGLLSNQINQLVKTGTLVWAATNQGVIVFDEKKSLLNKCPPPIYINNLEINSIVRAIKDTVSLLYNENHLKINFTGLSYKTNSKLQYHYILEGLDLTWSSTQNTSIQYTTLPPGNYRFKVYANNSDGTKSIQPATFFLHISSPFWQRWWFRTLVIIVLIGTGLVIGNYRQNILKKQAIEKSEISRKMAELKLMALSAQMNPHFLFNSINSIQLFILQNDSKAAQKHLAKFSKLIRQILENSRQEYISLTKEISTLTLYIELECLRFSSKFNFLISVGENIFPEKCLIPPLLIQPYVENAIWHGLMHVTGYSPELKITITKEGDLLKCIIDDNGIGRDRAQKIRKENGHESMGLSINQERIETIHALYGTSNSHTVTIIDKFTPDNLPAGTRVELILPYLIHQKSQE